MAKEDFIVTTRGSRSENPSRRYAYRMAESFFRRWPLYLLPVLLLIGVGVLQARKSVADYMSIGVVSVVDNPLLGDLSTIQSTGATGYETPAGGTSRTMNELLGTDGFVRDVAERAGFKPALDAGTLTLNDIRLHVYSSANGYQLLQVVATWPSSESARQLAQATIDGYISYVKDAQIAKTKDASEFWATRAQAYQDKVDTANEALQAYVVAHPAPAVGDRTEAQQLEISALTGTIDQAQTQVSNAVSQKESADLTTQELSTAAGRGLQVVDPPVAALAPQSARRAQILTLAIYVVLGIILAATLLMVSAFLDRTIRSAEDIAAASGLAVVATVPSVSELRKRSKQDKQKLGRSGKRALAAST